MEVSKRLLNSVVKHEGFRAYPYKDTTGVTTIGHGLTWLSVAESTLVVQVRLSEIGDHLDGRLNFFKVLPDGMKEILVEMAYQMGVEGLMGFPKMLHAMAVEDWEKASNEGLDSKWATQDSPLRAQEMMAIVKDTNWYTTE